MQSDADIQPSVKNMHEWYNKDATTFYTKRKELEHLYELSQAYGHVAPESPPQGLGLPPLGRGSLGQESPPRGLGQGPSSHITDGEYMEAATALIQLKK